ncbi:JmjC domain-containing protein [Streptomyces abikoensis]|uniref:JmjC domain-containing protein n=1 Tax=Streptomyces abikoensis TaxID=97398 RepID=UPI0037244009
MALERLITNPADLRGRWPDTPQIHRGDPSAFASLLTLEGIDALVDLACLAPRNTVLVSSGQLVDRPRFVNSERIIPGAVRRHIAQGGTLSLRRLHEVLPAVSQFCRELEAETGHPVQANAYLTPAGGQGFRHHWDTHTVVVAQLAGAKVWELQRPAVRDPLAPQDNWTFADKDHYRRLFESAAPDMSPTLRPGDVLWVPRGWVHNPYAPADASEPSLHLTFGLLNLTHHWLAQQLATEAAECDELRRALPLSPDPDTLAGEAEAVRSSLIRWLDGLSPEQVQRLARRALDRQQDERHGPPGTGDSADGRRH